MEILGIVAGVPLFLLLTFIGLLVNLLQVACYLTIRPLSKSTFRRINGAISEILWLVIVWAMEWWAGFEVKLYSDIETYQLMGKEPALLMSNHVSDADVLLIYILAQHAGCLRGVLSIAKKSMQYLPVFGWANWLNGWIFLDRDWAKDEKKLKSNFEALKDFPVPFWITIFPEGTRLTPEKLVEAQIYAPSKGFPIPKNVLIPKTKGFVTAVQSMRSFIPIIYDVSIAIPKDQPFPTLLRFLKMQPSKVKVHVKRYSMKEMPESDEGLAQWCRDKFIAKDALLHKFATTGIFDEEEITDFRRSVKPFIVVLLFLFTFCIGAWKLCQSFCLLSTSRGFTILGTIIGSVAVLVHIFLEYTKLPSQKSKS